MIHDRTLELLDDFVDGALDPREEREIRRHLMQCEECRAEERALRTLLEHAAELPGEVLPERDLWTGILPRLEAREPAAGVPDTEGAWIRTLRRPRALPSWMLAAASVALVVSTSLLTMRFAPAGDDRSAALPVERAAPPAPAAAAPTAFAAFRPAEREYRQAIEELSAVLEARRGDLAPETVEVVEANLRVIDRAIEESRAALAADPASRELTLMLAGAYDAKLGVLRRAVQL